MATVSGGDNMEAALAEIAKELTKAASVEVRFPSGGTYGDVTSIPLVAAIQEFGAPEKTIPPRPR